MFPKRGLSTLADNPFFFFNKGHMKDKDLRDYTHRVVLEKEHRDPTVRVIDEFCINNGQCRADIVTISDEGFHGYELKSAKDNLKRLPAQVKHYSDMMNEVTLIVADNHVKQAEVLIPDWWGIEVASWAKDNNHPDSPGFILLETQRLAEANPVFNKKTLVDLLWRPELEQILFASIGDKRILSMRKYHLRNLMVSSYNLEQIQAVCAHALRARTDWRVK